MEIIENNTNEIPTNEEPIKRPVGRPRIRPYVEKKESIKYQYELQYKGETKTFKSMREVSEYTGKSQTCLFRILLNKNVYKKKDSQHLKEIKLTKINI